MKKIIALILTLLMAVMSFASCEEPDEKKTTNTTEVAEAEQKETEELSDEEAIIQIIDDLYRASCKMDYEEAKKIVHERLYDDLGNIEQQLIEMYESMAEHGRIYKDDIEKHLTTDLNYHKKMSEKGSYEIESISINGDEATVKIIAESAEADYDKLCEGVEEYGDLSPEVIYIEKLYNEFCGMDRGLAMVKLPIEEYSDVRLQVMAKIHDEIITRAYKMEEYEGTIELRKINGKWLIYDWNEYQ